MSPDSQGKYHDVYGRAKTVRIGKWRWPPPREDNAAAPNSYIEFKMKKQQERHGGMDENGRLFSEDFVEFPEIPGMDQEDPEDIFPSREPQGSHAAIRPQQHQSKDMTPPKTQDLKHDENEEIIRAFEGDDRPTPGSIGKLRISSEMRAKLEQLTMDHSVRSSHKDTRSRVYSFPTSRPKGDGADDQQRPTGQSQLDGSSVRKLEESRKALLEQKLTGRGRDQSDVAMSRSERRVDSFEPHPPLEATGVGMGRTLAEQRKAEADQAFVVENLVKTQVEKMERASRDIREIREELGHPMAHPSRTSTQHAEYGLSSQSSSRYFSQVPPTDKSLYEQSSQASRSIIYEESLASSRGYSHHGYHDSDARAMYSAKSHILPPPPVGPMKSAIHSQGPPSLTASSSYYAPSSLVVPKHRDPPRPISPPKLLHEKTASDRIEFEESSEFLKPIDTAPPTILDTPEQRTLESIKTKLFPVNSASFFCYTKVPWELRIRKEVFSPSEKLDNPLTLHLVFCQVVLDTYAPACIRLNREEKQKLQQLVEGYSISTTNLHSSNHKLAMKRNVVSLAKDFPNYFSRLFPVSGGRNLSSVQLLGVSHSGVRLVRRERDAICDYLRVLDTLSFEDIAEVSVPRASTLQILLRNGGWMTLYSHKAERIRNMIQRYCMEAAQGGHEYVRAVADYITREPTLLSFRQGDIIRVVKNKNIHVDKGWFYGALDTGETGIFPCEYVVPLGKQEVHKTGQRTGESSTNSQFQYSRQNGTTVTSNSQHNGVIQNGSKEGPSSWVESKVEHFDEGRSDITQSTQANNDAKSLLQFALFNFRESLDKYEMLRTRDGSIRGSIKLIESLKTKKKGKKGKDSDWTWKELADMVKYTKSPIQTSLLKFESPELSKYAVECFTAIMWYMGDYPMSKNQTEVDCVFTILVNCHKYPQLRDEIYCQLMKQTTNNKSPKPDSCQRGWRLFSIVASYFECSDSLKPYLFKYLETAAYDKRRAYHGTAMVCLQNLRKTFKYGGRKNVPGIEEISAISVGRNSKRQIYRLPGGTERVINTKSTTVVQDIIEEICGILNVRNQLEMEEFSLYCIIEGDPYTMPLNREEYILDVTTELLKSGQVFYLIFCRSVWYYPLQLDNQLYIEVIFNQVAPDYLEGLLLVMPGERLSDHVVPDVAKVAALLHRAADMDHTPAKEEVKYLLPKPVLSMRDIRPAQWVEFVQHNWPSMTPLTTTEAKAQCLDILQKWPLFGSCFFIVKWIRGSLQHVDHILALNREGVHFLDVVTHETVWKYPFSEVISTRKVRAEDGTLFLDMKCGNLMVQKITRIQTDQAHEVSRLIRQYINIEQRQRGSSKEDSTQDITLSRHTDK